jgi:hypothetical protein
MCSVPTEVPAVDRARWLAELSEALGRAHRLLAAMDLNDGDRKAGLELNLRIHAAQLEVQSLRLSRSLQPRTQSDPKWTRLAPWHSALPDGG